VGLFTFFLFFWGFSSAQPTKIGGREHFGIFNLGQTGPKIQIARQCILFIFNWVQTSWALGLVGFHWLQYWSHVNGFLHAVIMKPDSSSAQLDYFDENPVAKLSSSTCPAFSTI